MAAQSYELTPETVQHYLRDKGLAADGETIRAVALGGGVSNIVVRVERGSDPNRPWVVKQALAKLRVRDEWLCGRERILREAEAIGSLQLALGASSLPHVIHVDRDAFLYVMTAAPAGSRPWKELLLEGEVDLGVARSAGEMLARLMTAGAPGSALERRFRDQTVFRQLRIDPYYRTTARRHPDLRRIIEALISESADVRTSLVHGDYSPKNMLVCGGRIFLIDFEVVHWGDPAFDAAFLLNHLFLKSFHQPRFASRYAGAAGAFWRSLSQCAGENLQPCFERLTVRHLGALMLARIDGKSPVEYIRDPKTKETVRRTARSLLLNPPESIAHTIETVCDPLIASS